MSFETIFITEGQDCTPAAEIQYGGQRLCIIRCSAAGMPEIQFVQDLYVGRDVEMTFPLQQFFGAIELAVDDLAAWLKKLADDQATT